MIELVFRAALLTRLAIGQVNDKLSPTEAGVLSTLTRRRQRITELAELEGLARPSVTLMVRRLEERGLVARGRDDEDGRVAIVSITASGAAALEEFRARADVVLRDCLTERSDDQLDALAAAVDTLQELIDVIQERRG